MSIQSASQLELTVETEASGQRLDQLLADRLEYSRSHLQNWIKKGLVRLNGAATKPSARLKAGQTIFIEIPPLEPAEPKPDPSINLNVIYEDPHLLVIDKKRGLVVHPAAGNPDGTLVNALLAHCEQWSGIGGVSRPGIVHRLDKDTSGLMVVAKSDRAHLGLQQQFSDRLVTKIYKALVWGIPHPLEGRINQPLARDPKDRLRMAVVAGGKEAITDYMVIEQYRQTFSLVEIRLHTGRTHQIRVHLAWLGFPILGDRVYGRPGQSYGLVGQALHCCHLGFKHPLSGDRLEFNSAPPQDFMLAKASLSS